jgi:hypothetical protein
MVQQARGFDSLCEYDDSLQADQQPFHCLAFFEFGKALLLSTNPEPSSVSRRASCVCVCFFPTPHTARAPL